MGRGGERGRGGFRGGRGGFRPRVGGTDGTSPAEKVEGENA